MRLKKVFLINRAPFEKLHLELSDDNVSLVSGINGAGKTTLLSYIVDAFYELAREAYISEFEDKANKYYRFSSSTFSMNATELSIVYLRFDIDEMTCADYVDIRGDCEEELYNELIPLEDKIRFSMISKGLEREGVKKYWAVTDKKTIKKVFSNNLLTYFPAYRYETPYFLNDPYKMNLSFNTETRFSGRLPNPIEVTSDLPQIANWIMDVVLDSYLYPGNALPLLEQINNIMTNILFSKLGVHTRIGIGPRTFGANRIAIMARDKKDIQIYPNIFNMSSGELALLCLFGELIKQADAIDKNTDTVTGIVLIDEIDKHLHIQLQKDILPKLICMFPNVQFIVSSHSPFIGLGFDEHEEISSSIYDLDNDGMKCPSQDNKLFKEVYDIMINQNNQYFSRYKQLQKKIESGGRPLIITEGKTDWKHLEAAMDRLSIADIDIDIYKYEEILGDSKLKQLLEDYAKIPQPRKIIGLFDRDNIKSLKFDELLSSEYCCLNNNVYAFAIPCVNENEYGTEISIEHYYKREFLTKEDSNGRRVFLGDEFYERGISKDSKYHTLCKGMDKKVAQCGIIDDRVYDIKNDPEEKNSLALSKNDFATLILNKDPFAEEFEFNNFSLIFDIIRKIIEIDE